MRCALYRQRWRNKRQPARGGEEDGERRKRIRRGGGEGREATKMRRWAREGKASVPEVSPCQMHEGE